MDLLTSIREYSLPSPTRDVTSPPWCPPKETLLPLLPSLSPAGRIILERDSNPLRNRSVPFRSLSRSLEFADKDFVIRDRLSPIYLFIYFKVGLKLRPYFMQHNILRNVASKWNVYVITRRDHIYEYRVKYAVITLYRAL